MMKRIFLFGVFFAFIGCTDDVTHENVERQNPHNNPEISPDGLKLKWVNGLFFSEYFYHTNGFVDSIYQIDRGGSYVTAKKFVYNDLNQITQITDYEIVKQAPKYNRKDVTYYTYNAINQIISTLIYDQNGVAINYQTHSYNRNGMLNNPSYIVIENGNVVKHRTTQYEFDGTINPHYNLYPQAYRVLKFINKNNITLTKYSDEDYHVHTLKYNEADYIIEEHISNTPLDAEDYRGFTYY